MRIDLRHDCYAHLNTLDLVKCLKESYLWAVLLVSHQCERGGLGSGCSLLEAASAAAQKELGRYVQRSSIEQPHQLHRSSRLRQLGHESLHAALDLGEVADSVLQEHGTDEGAASLPHTPVHGEDAIASGRHSAVSLEL